MTAGIILGVVILLCMLGIMLWGVLTERRR